MSTSERIQIDPRSCHGKPVIRDTRVPVSVMIGSLAVGMDLAEIEAEYGMTAEDVRAALDFANVDGHRVSFRPALVPDES